ncbi:MAG: DUF3800 domain-containing protein [Candidatus Gracilibacteria bacterium]|jgi:hypothetical protein
MNNTKYFFVDESGDCTFFNRDGECIVGQFGCSPILILGYIETENPIAIRQGLARLREEIAQDDYLAPIPSIAKTKVHFHAKDDSAEVREKVFKLIKTFDFKAQFIVARKRLDVFMKRHKNNEDIFYNEIVSRLFERSLHVNDNVIYFSKRDSGNKQNHFTNAIHSAISNFESKYNKKIETQTQVLVQVPTVEPCLQVIDYLNWAVYRAYTKSESRYFDFLKEKISFLCDIYDFEKYPNNFYNKKNIFSINKISPLALGGEPRVAWSQLSQPKD